MWVDSDGFESMSKYKAVIPTSVAKAMDVAVFEAIKASKDGKFDNTPYVGTLKNSGADSGSVPRLRQQDPGRDQGRDRAAARRTSRAARSRSKPDPVTGTCTGGDQLVASPLRYRRRSTHPRGRTRGTGSRQRPVAPRDHEALRLVHRGGSGRPGRPSRRDPLPAGRERRRQVHVDERVVRPAAARRRRDRHRRPAPVVRQPARGDGRRHRHGAPALHARRRVHRHRDPDAGPRGRGPT